MNPNYKLSKTSENSWSIKDILGHVSTWEHEALVCLPVILRGEKPKSYRRDYGGIDAFNALKIRQKANMPLNLVLAEFQAVHLQLMDYLHTIPEEEYKSGTRFMRRLGWDTFKHYPEHAKSSARS